MKRKKIIINSIVCAGIFAVLSTGSVKAFSEKYETKSVAAFSAKSTSDAKDLKEVQGLNLSSESKPQEETFGEGTESNLMAGEDVKEQELINAAVDAFKYYLDITIDPIQYDMKVTYFEPYKDLEASYLVTTQAGQSENMKILSDNNNIGLDGFPTKEAQKKLKPEFLASYDENGQLQDFSAMNISWEKESEIPITVEEAKKVAREFVESKNLIADGNIEFMCANVVAEGRIYVVYQNGEDGGIGIGVNTFASKVEDFQYMSREKAEIISRPFEEGSGVG